MLIKVDDKYYDLNQLLSISAIESDYEDFTKLYFYGEEETHLPKKFAETVAYLQSKGLKLLCSCDEEAVVLDKVVSVTLEDETTADFTFTDGNTFTLQFDKPCEEVLGVTDCFIVEEAEEDFEDDSDDDTDLDPDMEAEDFFTEPDQVKLKKAIKVTEELPEEYFGVETAEKADLPQVKSSVKNYSTTTKPKESNFIQMALIAVIVTGVVLVALHLLGVVK